MSWTTVIPVRRCETAKSRLHGRSPALARAIALDTILAASRAQAVGAVVVVTDDDTLGAALAPLVQRETANLRVVRQGGVVGLNPSIRLGIHLAGQELGRMPLAVLLGDLPALRPADLDAALSHAARFPRAVVADREGTGTTLLTAQVGARMDPAFGAGSFARHVDGGHEPLPVPERSSVRWDVDTRADLEASVALGVGEHTAAALAPRFIAARIA